jgi:topoisomerase IA-like protein
MLIDKIQERGYVKKENIKGFEIVCKDFELENGEIYEIETKREFGNEHNKLLIQPLGIIVMEFLNKHFLDIFNYDYTKNMEDDLDKICKGEKQLHELCKECNSQLDRLIENLKNEKKVEIQIDENHTFMIGKYGPVIKCIQIIDGKEEVSFKPIKKDIDIHKIENMEYTIDEIVDIKPNLNQNVKSKPKNQYILGNFKNQDVILRKGKFGLYITWGKKTKSLSKLGNRPIENITFEEVQKYLD